MLVAVIVPKNEHILLSQAADDIETMCKPAEIYEFDIDEFEIQLENNVEGDCVTWRVRHYNDYNKG